MLTIVMGDEGQGMVEYALMMALIVLVAVGALSLLGDKVYLTLYARAAAELF